ncbi:MAG: hypothetical protein Q9160_008638 [Pyrenula sp. 1 TL-2023]
MAEAVGVVLGIASLVFSAVENYRKTTKFFNSIKHFPRKLKEALQILETQELCFRKANERLLSSIVQEDQARQMLNDPTHGGWQDGTIAREFAMFLGESLQGFESAVSLVIDELMSIRDEFRKFEIAETEPSGSIKKRLRFAFKQSKIEESLRALREKTQDFVALTSLTSTQSQTRGETLSSPPRANRDLTRFLRVKQTAQDLHLALGSACTVHTDHHAHLSLEPGYSEADQIRFTLAFSQLSLKDPARTTDNPHQSTWLTVESTVTGTIQPIRTTEKSLDLLPRSLKRTSDDQGSNDASAKLAAVKKHLRFQDEQEKCCLAQAAPSRGIEDPLINLCRKGNFCHQLSKFISQSRPATQAIGSFEISSGSKHLIYIDSKYQRIWESSAKPKLKTLYQMISEIDGDNTAVGVALSQKIGLARQLARAVLHYHATAWLQEDWDSHQILLSSSRLVDDGSETSLEAYVTSRIHGPHNDQASPTVGPNALVVRNHLLFQLGIMLLELAYQKSISELVSPLDKIGASPNDVPYCTANRLAGKVSAIVGPRYAEVVRKCIHCDFGHGFDLKQSKLQEAFYQTVVCELDKLENILREW